MRVKVRAVRILIAFLLTTLVATLSGCGGSSSGGGGAIVVFGTVLDDRGSPRPLVPVLVAGQVTFSDEMGNFQVGNVPTPYDVVLLDPTGPSATAYVGLTRADPKLPMIRGWREHHADVTGTVSGGVGYPLPANHTTAIVFSGPSNANGEGSASSTTGDLSVYSEVVPGNFPGSQYVGGPSWSGSVDNHLVYHVLQWERDPVTFEAVLFTGYYANGAPFRAGATTNLGSLPLFSPVSNFDVNGTYTLPPGHVLEDVRLRVEFPPYATFPLPGDPTAAGGTYSARAPLLVGSLYTAEVEGRDGNSFSIARITFPASAPNVPPLDVQPVNTTLSPEANATGITTDTTFQWTPSCFGIHILFITRSGQPNYYVVTADTQARIPDLSAYGLGLPSNELLFWSVYAYGPYASVDELAGTGYFVVPDTTAYRTRTATVPFTTAP